MSNNATVTLRFVGDARNAKAAIADLTRDVNRLGRSGSTSGESMSRGAATASRSYNVTDNSIRRIIESSMRMGQAGQAAGMRLARAGQESVRSWNQFFETAREIRATLAILAGLKLGGAAIGSIIQLSDGYTNLSSKLRTVTENEMQLNRIRDEAYEISQRSRTQLDATVTLYARLTRSTKDLNLTEQQRLRITETINKAYTLSGATVQEATNSIIQLTQGLASGTLRGEEFNSVAEQGPIILEMLSKSLGKNIGELRAMAKQGKLTAEVITTALLQGTALIDTQFAKVTLTIEGATIRVVNAWQKWLGEMNETTGAASTVAEALNGVANNMASIANAAVLLTEVGLLIFFGKISNSMLTFIKTQADTQIKTVQTAAAIRSEAAALAESTAATAGAAEAKVALTAQNFNVAKSEQAHAVAMAEVAAQRVVAIESTQVAAQVQLEYARYAQTRAFSEAEVAAAAQRTAAAEVILNEVTAESIALQNALNAANARVAASQTEMTAAYGRQTAALRAAHAARLAAAEATANLAGAQTGLAAAWGLARSAGSKLLALIGGWPTVVLAAAYATYQWYKDTVDLSQSTEQLTKSTEELIEATKKLKNPARDNNDALREQHQTQIELALEQRRGLQANVDYNMSWDRLTTTMGGSAAIAAFYGTKLDSLDEDIATNTEAVIKLKEAQRLYNEQIEKSAANTVKWGGVLAGVSSTAQTAASNLDMARFLKDAADFAKKQEEQRAQLQETVATYGQGKEALIAYQMSQKLATAATEMSTEQFEKYRGVVMREYEPLIALARAADAQTAAQKASNAAKKDANKDSRDLQREQEKYVEKIRDTVTNLMTEVETYGMSEGAVIRYTTARTNLTDVMRQEADAASYTIDALNADLKAKETLKKSYETLGEDIIGQIAIDAQYEQSLIRMTGRQRAFAEAYRKASNYFKDNEDLFRVQGISLEQYATASAEAAEKTFDLTEEADKLESVLSKFDGLKFGDNLVDSLKMVKEQMEKTWDPVQLMRMQAAVDVMNKSLEERNLALLSQGISSLQQFAKEGTVAYKAIAVAQDIVAYKQALIAISHQGEGDVYTAFARIAAMIAMMASIGLHVGGGGGASAPSARSAEVRQAQQGTGSILGDAEAKSESIAKATEITANATTALVGLNRGMLNALVALQNALGAAGNQLARGAGDVDFGDPGGGGLFLGMFGTSREIIDEGITILGGAITDLIDGLVVSAYQTIHENGGFFGSSSEYDVTSGLSDQFSRQFSLVIGSIVDTVREAALTLGLLPDDIQKAIDAFRVEEIRISLKGLTAEEQQKELEAVFSQIFDGLAGAVVPFIEQFQQVGEGLGETLVRVATEVQVVNEFFRQTGIVVNETDPEKFAQIADGLVQAVGGLDQFIESMSTFVNAFADKGEQLQIVQDSLNSAFEQAGLTLPATRDGMWELLQSLDATTEEGRKQIAIILQLAEASSQYYDLLDAQTEALKDYISLFTDLAVEIGDLSAFQQGLYQIGQWEQETIARANELAIAAGMQGASEETLSMIHRVAAQRVAQAIREIMAAAEDIVNQLYGDGADNSANDSIRDWGQTAVDQTNDVIAATRQLYEAQMAGLQSIEDYLIQMQFGDLSGLTPEQQLAEARRQLIELQQRAVSGDAEAMQQLPQMAQMFLQLLQGSEASGGDFNAGYDWVRQLLQSVVDQGPTVEDPGDAIPGGGTPISQEYLDGRDQHLADQEELNRRILAEQLVQHLHDLSEALNIPVLELAEQMHVPLMQLAEDLGIDLQTITAQSVAALADLATNLGIPLGELVEGLGMTLPDLHDGLLELTTQLSIDLTSLTGETARQLAQLGTDLGINLRDLSAALGIDLGKLTDINSPIFQALQDTIDELSPDIGVELQPFLDNIANAAGDEEANAAVKALRDHVDDLAPDIQALLAPFFPDILPPNALDQLDYLSQMAGNTDGMEAALNSARDSLIDIYAALRAGNHASGVPGYAVGSAYIAQDHLAMVHKGEGIVDAESWNVLRRYGIPVRNEGNSEAVVDEIRYLRKEVIELRRDSRTTREAHISTIRDEGNKDRAHLERVLRNGPVTKSGLY